MRTMSVLRRYHPQHGTDRSSLKPVAFSQKVGGQYFQALPYVLEARIAPGDLPIAGLARRDRQVVVFDRQPELFVVHRRKPLFDIFAVLEFFHPGIVSKAGMRLQISSADGVQG